jgi:hypothetical protein
VNYYWTNQWVIGREERALPADDPRHVPLSVLLRKVWQRFGGEFLITETAHVGDMRPIWLRAVVDECMKLIDDGVPLRGVCLYPILGMPEWHDRRVWTQMGLWELERANGRLERRLYEPMLEALHSAQELEEQHTRRLRKPRDEDASSRSLWQDRSG